jgi:DNA-binding transcriptional LysR family regulator
MPPVHPPMRLGLKQIEYFRAVMQAGTVSAAAALLNVSQPNVSRMIKYLEMRLGLALFERHKGRLRPTPEAAELYQEVQSLHLHLESLQEAARRIAAGESGRLRIGCSPSLGRQVIPRLIAELRRELPALELKLDILSVAQVVEFVLFNEGDCACTIFPIVHPLIASEEFARGRLVCAVPVGHRLAARATPLTARELAGEALIGFPSHTPHGQVVEEYFQQADIRPKCLALVRFAETACALAEQGNGVALVDEFTMSGGVFPSLVALPLKYRRPFGVYFHRLAAQPLSQAGARFRALLQAWQPD